MDTKVKYLEGLVPFTIEKIFFHNVQGKAWRMFLILDSGDTVILPVYPECPIQILSNEQIKGEIKSFREDAKKQKVDYEVIYNKLMDTLKEIED